MPRSRRQKRQGEKYVERGCPQFPTQNTPSYGHELIACLNQSTADDWLSGQLTDRPIFTSYKWHQEGIHP